MEGSVAKKMRKSKFSEEELCVMIREVEERKNIVQGTLSGSVTTDTKRNAWASITAAVNVVGGERRTPAEVRKKYVDFKSSAKRKAAAISRHQGTTGK